MSDALTRLRVAIDTCRNDPDRTGIRLTSREMRAVAAEIDRLREDCAEFYQVIGYFAHHAGARDAPETVKALNNRGAIPPAKAPDSRRWRIRCGGLRRRRSHWRVGTLRR